MSDSNQVKLLASKETAWAETPDQTAVLREVPMLSESLKAQKLTQEPGRLRDDRQADASLAVGEDALGQTNHNLHARDFIPFLESLLLNAIVTIDLDAETCTIDESAGTITADSGTPFTAAMIKAKFIKVAGAANSGNNGIKRVLSMTSTEITVPASELTDDEAAVDLDFDGSYIQNGTTTQSLLMEKYFSDKNIRFHYIGQMVSEATITLNPRGKAEISFTFMGEKGVLGFGGTPAASAGDGSPLSDYGDPVLRTQSDIGSIYEGGAATLEEINSATITVNNNLRIRPALGSDYSKEFGKGTLRVGGNIQAYFRDETMYNKYKNHTGSDLSFPIFDANDRGLAISIFDNRYDDTNPEATGQDADVFLPLQFSASKDATTGKTIQIDIIQ